MKKIATITILLFTMLCVASCDFSGNNTNNGNVVSVETVDSTEAVKPDSMVQCVAITKAGTQCQRLVYYPDTLCFQHYKMRMQSDTE